MTEREISDNIELAASCVYRLITHRPWMFATEQDKRNYAAIIRDAVTHATLEQQQEPTGQKEVA